jgi:hypothetical protein
MNLLRVVSLAVLLAGVALLGNMVAAGPSAKSQTGVELDRMESGSCAISCPADTPYAGRRASVTCQVGYSPVCECQRDDGKLAFCHPIATRP